MNDYDFEQHVRASLRAALDSELGPDPTWAESPAARRVAEVERRSRRRWPLRALAVAALIGAGGGAALLAGRLNPPPVVPVEAANGWIAFATAHDDPAGDYDTDIWFAALGQEPRRVVGDDSDSVDQVCPAFSPDGHSLAYGSIEGVFSTAAYQNSALVIADVGEDGTIAERLTIDLGDDLPPACPIWSPDAERLAFGVPRTSPGNPDRSGEGSEVWILRLSDGDITVIPDQLATDLEWSPDGSVLAIAGGPEAEAEWGVVRNGLQDARIHLYELSTGSMRTLDVEPSVSHLTWSPDGERIAFASHPPWADSREKLWIIDVETGQDEPLTARYGVLHGIGPVWSPDGETIAYQRLTGGSERHEVVLVTPDDRSEETGLASEVVMPQVRAAADGSTLELFPWRFSWSPDSKDLLYVAWTYPNGCCGEGTIEETWVVAVPTDPDAPAVLVADMEDIAACEVCDDVMPIPIQIWGRGPSE
jgi:dipeptidyl aminopeptidase/acylaminoacyl peptidase